MLKKVLVISLFIVVLCSNSVFAHEMYSGYPLRWNDVSYYSPASHNRLDVGCNGDGLDSTYSSKYQTEVQNWYSNSNNYVLSYNTLVDYSDVDFYTYRSTWPSAWGSSTVALTRQYDKYGNCFQDFGSFDSALKISYAVVYTNPGMNVGVGQRGIAGNVLGHELGHCIALGHPPAGTVSIMTQGQESWTSPQAHDRSDLASFYH